MAGHEAEAVDAGTAEGGAVLAGRECGHVVRGGRLGDHGQVGAAQHRARSAVLEVRQNVRRMRRHRGVEGGGVLLEEAAVDDRARDIEARVLGVAPLELVGADDAAGAEALDACSGFQTSTFSL